MRTATALLLSLALFLPRLAGAATITVDSTSPAASLPDACTLRGAINAALTAQPVGTCPAGDLQNFGDPPPNIIVLPTGAVFSFSQPYDNPGEPAALPNFFMTGPIIIEGNGATIERSDQLPVCVPGAATTPTTFRLINLIGGAIFAELTLRNLTLRNGCSSTEGGAISSNQSVASLFLDNVRIVGSRASNGSAVFFAGFGFVTIRQSHIAQNVATTGTTMRLQLAGNRIARVIASTFSQNIAVNTVLSATAGSVELRDSTFSGNRTTSPMLGTGEIVKLLGEGSHSVVHNTFADNEHASGNAHLAIAGSSTVQLQGNWMADTQGLNCSFGSAVILPTGVNLSTDQTCPTFALVNPGQMRPLGFYGSNVPTRPPLPGSAVIDVNSSCIDPATNQTLGPDARGVPRPQDGDTIPGAQCDVGAAEFVRNQAPTLVLPEKVATHVNEPVLVAPAITLSDSDARDLPIELRLEPDDGVLDFDASALDCTTGNGDADPVAVCRGSLAQLNAALTGLVYTPRLGFAGTDTLRVEVDDLGAGGDDELPRGAAEDLAIEVTANVDAMFENGFE